MSLVIINTLTMYRLYSYPMDTFPSPILSSPVRIRYQESKPVILVWDFVYVVVQVVANWVATNGGECRQLQLEGAPPGRVSS